MRILCNIFTLGKKELSSLLGDSVLVVLIVMVFTVMVYSSSKGVSTEVNNAPVGVINLDQSPLSRQIIDALQAPYFSTPIMVQREEVDALMDKGELIFVVEFPPNFQKDVQAGRAPEVQLLVDATTMTQAGMGQSYITQIFNREIQDFLQQSDLADQIAPTKPILNVRFNPNGDSSWQLAVMQVNNMITLITLVLVGAAVIREREHGTIEHLLVMPVGASELVLAKILANGLVICLAAVLSMRFMVQGVIQMPIAGSLWLYALGVLVFMFCIASLAVMLATLAPTMPQYSLLMMPLYVVALMFSGSSSPRSNMPATAQAISEYWPTTQFAQFAQNVLFRSADITMVWQPLSIMAMTGAVFLAYALFRFRKMLEKQG